MATRAGTALRPYMAGQFSLNVRVGRPCTTTAGANRNARRTLTLLDPTGTLGGSKYGFVNAWDWSGTRSYNGMLLSLNKRMSRNFSVTANYTLSHCIGNRVTTLLQGRSGVGVWNTRSFAGISPSGSKTFGYTPGMKTAISISDEVFHKAEHFARRQRKSRSQLYTEALAEFLARHDADAITEAMNRALEQVGQRVEPFVREAARRALKRAEW